MNLDSLFEGVEVHGLSLFAYAVTVAELFDMLPEFDESAVPAWDALIQSNEILANRILGDIKVEYVKDDPYKNFNDLVLDVVNNKHLAVFKTPEGTHKAMTASQNDLFRALHDALAHVGSNSKEFLRHAMKNDGTVYSPLWGGTFTVRGEMNAYLIHARMAPKAAVPALFTEVVGQICYYFVTGSYAKNKVAIIPDVDFMNIGICSGYAAQRMKEIEEQINDPGVKEIDTNVQGIKLDKSKIRWKLLSKGTGAGNIS